MEGHIKQLKEVQTKITQIRNNLKSVYSDSHQARMAAFDLTDAVTSLDDALIWLKEHTDPPLIKIDEAK